MLEDQQALVRAENFIFEFFQLGRDIAFTGRQGLLAGEGIRHRIGVGTADLNVVAEHFIEADLQLGDAGLLTVAGLEVGEVALAAVHDVAQFIDLTVIACADGAAVL